MEKSWKNLLDKDQRHIANEQKTTLRIKKQRSQKSVS